MTRDEILNMPAGREMNIEIIKIVMDWRHVYTSEVTYTYINPKYGAVINFSPSTDISAAWDVVEKMPAGFELRLHEYKGLGNSMNGWQAEFHEPGTENYTVWGDTAPLAICRAALLAVMDL